MTEDYREKLNAAQEFQDYVAIQLHKRLGIGVNQLVSKKYQAEYGESIAGIEIKYDKLFRKTGNFYVEYQEKSNPNNPRYVDSGILRNDNTWLWVIGDYEDLYVIAKEYLKHVYHTVVGNRRRQESFGIRLVETSTSRGMLLPVPFVTDRICAAHIGKNKADGECIDF